MFNVGIVADSQVRVSSSSVSLFTEVFQTLTISPNGGWNLIDLTSFGVPANAVCVILVDNSRSNRQNRIGVRSVGSSTNRDINLVEAESGGRSNATFIVQSNANSSIEIKPTTTTYNHATLLGYFNSTIGFNDRWKSITPSNSTTYLPFTINNASANDVATIVTIYKETAVTGLVGIRSTTDTDTTTIELNEAESGGHVFWSRTVNLDASKNCDYVKEKTNCVFRDSGSWTGITFTSSDSVFAINYVPTSLNTWQTVTVDSSIPVGATIEVTMFNKYNLNEYNVGVRKVGSSLHRVVDIHEAEKSSSSVNTYTDYVEVDGNNQIEMYAESTAQTYMKINGWFT
jgi:hypothetical protein